ncbi:MAG: hypothetical protein J7J67_02930 [Thermoproteales archaeon]|nr:hypothetical protein [Thermoproteales archaeon]
MKKTITIEVPEWISEEDVKEIKRLLAKFLAESMKNVADQKIYRTYLALMFPETGFTELENESEKLREIRKKEKERIS